MGEVCTSVLFIGLVARVLLSHLDSAGRCSSGGGFVFSGRASMEDLSLPDDLGEILTQQLLKTTSHKGDEFDYDCEFD